MLASDAALRITEIFCSLQGESSWSGKRTTFIRLTGCPLRCVYCDTAYAFQGGEIVSLLDILEQVKNYGAQYGCVTGGEPLAQPNCISLLKILCDAGYKVSLETSGSIDVSPVDRRVKKIVDLKTPASKEEGRNLYQNIEALTDYDEVKFVIADRNDYEWSVEKAKAFDLCERAGDVLFSPIVMKHEQGAEKLSIEEMNPSDLANWIIDDQLEVRMQLQTHKLLWGDEPGH